MKRFVFFYLMILIVILSVKVSYCDYSYDGIHPNAGTRFFPFLKMQYDARSEAMGGACASIPNEIYGIVSNPAALAVIDKTQAMISYKLVILDVRAGTLAFAQPYKSLGVFGGNLIYLSYGVLEPVDENNKKIEGTLNPFSVAGGVSWAKTLMESLSLGITIKGIYDRLSEGIDDEIPECSADGFAIDVGVQSRTQSSRIVYGVLIRNIGFIRSSYSDDTEKTGLPLSFASGIYFDFPSVKATFELEKATDDFLKYKIGLCLNLYKHSFFIRGGFNFSQRTLEKAISNIKNIFSKDDNTETDEDDYQSDNWSLVGVGVGIKSKVRETDLNIDAALNFRVNRLPPAFTLTLLIGF